MKFPFASAVNGICLARMQEVFYIFYNDPGTEHKNNKLEDLEQHGDIISFRHKKISRETDYSPADFRLIFGYDKIPHKIYAPTVAAGISVNMILPSLCKL